MTQSEKATSPGIAVK